MPGTLVELIFTINLDSSAVSIFQIRTLRQRGQLVPWYTPMKCSREGLRPGNPAGTLLTTLQWGPRGSLTLRKKRAIISMGGGTGESAEGRRPIEVRPSPHTLWPGLAQLPRRRCSLQFAVLGTSRCPLQSGALLSWPEPPAQVPWCLASPTTCQPSSHLLWVRSQALAEAQAESSKVWLASEGLYF